MIQNLSVLFKSTIKTLEILYVLENKKPAARILVNEDDLDSIIDFIKNNDLEYSLSNFKLKKINSNSYYSDKSVKISKDSEEHGYFSVCISKIKELAEKANAYQENNMHLELGIVLGYPKCCCDFFKEQFNENNYDLTLSALENSEGYEFPFQTNIATRHFDISLLNHFPCNFNCKPSIEIAKENLGIIKNFSEQLHGSFINIMKCTVLYNNNGVFLLNNYKILKKSQGDFLVPQKSKIFVEIKNELIFKNIVTTNKNNLYDLLIKNKKIGIIDKNKIKINNKEIDDIGLMVFT